MDDLHRTDRARADRTPDAEPLHEGPGEPVGLLARLRDLGTAALAGAVCVLVGVVLVAIPTVVAWFADDRSEASLWQSVGAAVDVWALAHRAVVHAPGVDVVLAPLLLTAVPVALSWYAARHVLLARPEIRGRVATIGGWRPALHALGGVPAGAFVAGYLVTALVVAETAAFGVAPVGLPSLVPGALLLPALGVLAVWVEEHRREEHPGIAAARDWLRAHVPVMAQRGIPAALETLVALSAVALLLVLGLVLLRGTRILTLYSALDAGAVGTTVLTLGQLAALPNLMVWALSWLTGAGMTVGTVHVGWAESTRGDLPLIPVLGALPEPGAMPPGTWAMALVPIVAGGWVGHRAMDHSVRLSSWWSKAKVALVSTVTVAVVALLLGWLATGGLTPGLLGTVGVEPWRFAGLLAAEIGLGALVYVTVAHLRGRRLARP